MDKAFLPIQLPSEEEFSKECSEKSLFINDDMSRAYTNTISEVESNNSMGSADSISLSSGRNAALTSSSDVDWFSFKVPSSGEYRFDISNIASNYDYDMELFSSQNVSLGSSATSESYETIITTLQGNQTVYLRVYPYSPSTSSQKYYVTVTNDAMALLNWTYTFNGSDPKRNVTSPYGNRSSGAHYGVDISASGTDIYSSTDGIKKYGGSDMSGSMGYYAVVQVDSSQAPAGYGNSTMVTYMHMNSPSPLSNNEYVYSGTSLIGYAGGSGYNNLNYYGHHLHLQVSTNGTQTAAQSYSSTINPLRFFPNINFTASPSYGEINYSLQSNNTLELNNTSHLLDDTLIRYVGVDKYETWLASTKKTTNTVKDFWDYFYINNQLCRSIMQESGVFDYYDMESIFALRENE